MAEIDKEGIRRLYENAAYMLEGWLACCPNVSARGDFHMTRHLLVLSNYFLSISEMLRVQTEKHVNPPA